MSDIFSSLGLNTRVTVGISVSTNNRIELAYVDKSNRSVIKYAARELHYNNAIKEIVDEEELVICLQELFKEVGLQPVNCNVVFNVPNVHFSFAQIPLIVPDEQVATTLLSEVEQQYLFKRNEPVISWANTESVSSKSDMRNIVYGAVQEKSVMTIVQACKTLGAKLVAIETSYSAMIRGVIYSGILDSEINNNQTTNILFITSNNFSIFSMAGDKLIEYYEEPLAIKSFANDEVYIAISSAAAAALGSYPTQNLLIVSETDEVSAELLAGKFRFDGSIKYLDRNKYTNKPFTNISYSILQTYLPYITLESVGAAVYNYEAEGIKFNFLSDSEATGQNIMSINIGGKEIELNQAAIGILFISAAVVIGIAAIIATSVLKNTNTSLQAEINEYNNEQIRLAEEIKKSDTPVDLVDIYAVTQKIFTENQNEVSLVNGLSSEIPKEAWVEYFKTNSKGEVIIKGKSTESQHIYTFFKGLKRENSDIYISQLELDFDPTALIPDMSSGSNIFSYEIASTKNRSMGQPDTGQPMDQQSYEEGGSSLPLFNNADGMPPPISAAP